MAKSASAGCASERHNVSRDAGGALRSRGRGRSGVSNESRGGIHHRDGRSGNRITGNSIHDNTGLGIDLGNDGVTPNDAGDTDSNADANFLQNFPVITGVFVLPTENTIKGTINQCVLRMVL